MKTLKFKATGMEHYKDAINSLRYENDDYNLKGSELAEQCGPGKVWKYNYAYSKIELIPEPENEYDKNAVAVYLDGKMVAHIKKGSCSQVKNLLASGTVKGIDADIGGGPYKYITEDDDGKVEVDTGDSYLYIHITFYVDDGKLEAIAEPTLEAFTPPETKKHNGWKIAVRVFAILFVLFGAMMMFITPAGAGFIALGFVLFFVSK